MNKRNFLKTLSGVGAFLGIGSAQANPQTINIYTADEIIDKEKLKAEYIKMVNQEEDLRLRLSAEKDDRGYYSGVYDAEIAMLKFNLDGERLEGGVFTIDEIEKTVLYWDGKEQVHASGEVEIIGLSDSKRRAIIDEQKNRIRNYVS